MYDAQRSPGREHVPLYSKGFAVLRALQLVASLLLVGTAAAAVVGRVVSVGACFMVSTGILSLFSTTYLIIAHRYHRIYNYWAALAIDVFVPVFAITSVALLAVEGAAVLELGSFSCESYACHWDGPDEQVVYLSLLAATIVVGVLHIIFFLFSLLINSRAIHHHRRAGLPSSGQRQATAEKTVRVATPTYLPVPSKTVCPYRMTYDGGTSFAPWSPDSLSPGDISPTERDSWPGVSERMGLME